MKNLFENKDLNKMIIEYKKLNISIDLAQRIYTSRLIGSNTNLVLHGGGNTSVKSIEKDIDGEEYKIIYVKGSGSDLSSIGPKGFPAVKMSPLKRLMKKKFITDEEMVSFIRKNLIDHTAPNPSVETLVHAIINEKFVDHTHSNSILEITNRPDGLGLAKQLFSKNFIIIPYVMPGYLLAKKVFDMYKQDNNIHGLILFRHGIFTFAETAKESYDRMIRAVNIAEKFLKNQSIKKIPKIKDKKLVISASEIAPVLKSYLSLKCDYILNFRSNKSLLSSINKRDIKISLKKGVITPDHVIRTKPEPLVLNFNNCKSLDDVNLILKQSFLIFKKNYLKYFNKNKNKCLQILDTVPQIILIQNMGMFSLGRNLKEAIINGDVSEMSIKTISKIEEKSYFKSISKKDIFDVEYWSLEQAKLKKSRGYMQGKVVIITGGAGTIGYATAEKFKENGAEVIIIDHNKKMIDKINSSFKFKGYICDVTNRNSFKKIMSDICLIYGGVDILISNAGTAIQHSIADIKDDELKKSFELNFFSHQVVASECVDIMLKQKKGGCLLFNISKQSVNPGVNFGAYGTAKAALLALCKQYALEHGHNGIRSNGINADKIESGLLTKEFIKDRAKARNVTIDNYLKGNLLNEKVMATDVAEAFYSLAISKKTTAAILTVDGGNIEASFR
jgi:rhamnose utilization protein RhaD (predicted bifunctional aldolase and dehydrogenase)/NAD(P)-dependent dehydrogenase (short-subunit alcohol dehydrogenase family)